ncbi:MAG: hypothetical protein HRU18_06755 [Pseudoalteromonas sp.]|uniref:hypothetical protein n=1 Tax=Pseudoalteromonas sp. TaxID=53249 RepID=UPI001D36788A|nr:hypothetical protein [Pseudoalteromonas sp.]NRA77890.1 hypothetical protein [Pseudoalteromonas sp.]
MSGLGIVQGIANIDTVAKQKKLNSARLTEAQNKAEMSGLKLQEFKSQAPMRKSQNETNLAALKEQLKAVQATNFKNETYTTFQAYDASGDAEVLNGFLASAKNSPIGAGAWGQFSRFDNLEDTPEVRAMLEKFGVTDHAGYFSDPSSVGNFAIATSGDGIKEIVDVDELQAMTGYTKTLAAEEMELKSKKAKLAADMRRGMTKNTSTALERMSRIMAKELGIPVYEAYEKLKAGTTSKGTSQIERLAAEEMKADSSLSYLDAMDKAVKRMTKGSADERFNTMPEGDEKDSLDKIRKDKDRTNDQKKADEVNKSKDTIDQLAGGDYLNTPLADIPEEARGKIAREMSRIQQEHPMPAADRKILTSIREITAQGATVADELTPEETGFFDNNFGTLKNYFINEIGGVAGKAAYHSFQSVMRHALYGSAQSTQETKNFVKAYGSLNEQYLPAIGKVKQALRGVQAKLQAVYDMNDPYIAKDRIGMSQDQLATVLTNIDSQIAKFGNNATVGENDIISPRQRSLEDILK